MLRGHGVEIIQDVKILVKVVLCTTEPIINFRRRSIEL